MLSYDPQGYTTASSKDDKFYKDMIASMGIGAVAGMVISPLTSCLIQNLGAFGVDTKYNLLVDDPVGLGDTPAVAQGKMFHGNLNVSLWCTSAVAQREVTATLAIPDYRVPANMREYTFVKRTPLAAESLTKENIFQFPSVLFRYVTLQIADVNSEMTISINFTGVKIQI